VAEGPRWNHVIQFAELAFVPPIRRWEFGAEGP
jgi:hypothetical protein